MKVSILIVTWERDFPWLRWCLKSIGKFARGFHEVVVAIPEDTPATSAIALTRDCPDLPVFRFYTFLDWPGKGFLRHMERILSADEICPEADFILHMDADCIFTEPVSPEDYFVDGKPVLIGAPYDWIVKKFSNPNHYRWKEAVEAALKGTSEFEFMRRHPAVHWRALYGATRAHICRHSGKPWPAYLASCQNTYPQTFAEFPTLGEMAWRAFRDKYHWLRQDLDPWPKDKLLQFWSHGPLEKPQNVWQGGEMHEMNPLEVFNRILT